MKKILLAFFRVMDILLSPLTVIIAAFSKLVTRAGIYRMPVTESIFMKFGVLPVADHYYQPLINPRKHLTHSLREDRFLPGIMMNDAVQLQLLNCFRYNDELLALPMDRTGLTGTGFYFNNHSFPPADAEYLYNIVRHTKPRKIVEIGSGFSTLITIKALEKNKLEDPAYTTEHTCIEPYEMPWLEKTGATIIRKKVEDTGNSFARSLEAGDILFIDSSHIIRPQGDVLFELLELLPQLKPGVLVHIHDIFTPKDYPDRWIFQQHRMWNEQYLLEAFLSMNQEYEVIGAVNYLAHHYGAALYAASPVFARRPEREPGSFWIRKK